MRLVAWLFCMIAPTTACATVYQVEVERDVPYAKGVVRDPSDPSATRLKDLLLDVYLPVDCQDDAKPVLIIIHGGGFRGGSKSAQFLQRIATYFAARGFAAFSIDYRLLDDHPPVPEKYQAMGRHAAAHAAFVDAKRAVRWVRANAVQYGVNPEKIAALGGSAGAVTALVLGVSDSGDFLADGPDDPTIPHGNPGQSSEIQAVIDCWGTAQFCLDEFDDKDPPILILHGTDDQNPNTSFSGAEAIRDICVEKNIPHEFQPLEGHGHGAWDAIVDDKTLSELAYAFVVTHVLEGKDPEPHHSE